MEREVRSGKGCEMSEVKWKWGKKGGRTGMGSGRWEEKSTVRRKIEES